MSSKQKTTSNKKTPIKVRQLQNKDNIKRRTISKIKETKYFILEFKSIKLLAGRDQN